MKTPLFVLFAMLCQITSAQNVGIGTPNPQATLDVRGNHRIGGSTSYITYDSNGRIEWKNSNLYVPVTQALIKHSAAADGLFYNNTAPISGQLEYRNALGDPVFYTNFVNGNGYFRGRLGIGTTNPLAPLGFSSTIGQKITLYGDAHPSYGIGIQPYLLQIHTDAPGSDIAFGYGSSSSFTEKFRIKTNGALSINGNSGTLGQVLTSNGNGAAPTWNNTPKYFFFQKPPGASETIPTTPIPVAPIDGQSFTLDFPATLIITINVNLFTSPGETEAQEPWYTFSLTDLVGHRTGAYSYIKPHPTTFVSNQATVTKYIPNVPAGTYTIDFNIRKMNSGGTCTYGNSQVIVMALPM